MRDRSLALRYARALLSVLTDPTQAEAADAFLTALAGVLEESNELRDVLLDPAMSRTKRIEILTAIARDKDMPESMTNFLTTLVDNNRATALPTIATVFREAREAAAGIVPAEITTAEPLTPELETLARDAIKRRTGREVELTCKVEPKLLGGAVTRIGSTVFDGSLRNQLQQLRRQMTQE